ncbi:MAG: phage tail protein [Bacteroidales bacterium]
MSTNHYRFPVAFYFQVKIGLEEIAFKEVSGLSTEMEVETIREGGVNNYEYHLPKQTKHNNIVLKRAILPINSNVIVWVKDILEGDFSKPIKMKNISIHLMDENGKITYSWNCENAFPVKWEIDSLNSEKNEVLLETLELSYMSIARS